MSLAEQQQQQQQQQQQKTNTNLVAHPSSRHHHRLEDDLAPVVVDEVVMVVQSKNLNHPQQCRSQGVGGCRRPSSVATSPPYGKGRRRRPRGDGVIAHLKRLFEQRQWTTQGGMAATDGVDSVNGAATGCPVGWRRRGCRVGVRVSFLFSSTRLRNVCPIRT
ncbi:hypothetical protein PIB30_056833 [Stylosanthes scabra]|uniref:Uncharacterized protein n=1 Tax=Stylosanthes scabra TaxID=79078 RepID=A0ABU6XHD6_9FABA|nr:hypothetical protein [Stylosanthes scabra]